MKYSKVPLIARTKFIQEIEMNEKKLAGWMMIALIIIGIFGLFTALLSFVNEYDYVGAGLCLLASGYAFSSVLKAYR